MTSIGAYNANMMTKYTREYLQMVFIQAQQPAMQWVTSLTILPLVAFSGMHSVWLPAPFQRDLLCMNFGFRGTWQVGFLSVLYR